MRPSAYEPTIFTEVCNPHLNDNSWKKFFAFAPLRRPSTKFFVVLARISQHNIDQTHFSVFGSLYSEIEFDR